MPRPTGVTASAVVAILGSAFTLLVAVGFIVAAFGPQPTPAVPGFKVVLFVMTAIVLGLGGLGIWTAIALLRLKPWARISMLVFAGFTAAISAMAVVAMSLMPLPLTAPSSPGAPPIAIIRPFLIAVYAVPLAIGVWWIVYFNRKSVKEAFALPYVPGAPSARPLSISIIGWWMVVGAFGSVFPVIVDMPALIFGIRLDGWSARAYYIFFAALSGYIGWGLLKLQERARLITLGFIVFTVVHTTFIAVVPSARAALVEMQSTMTFMGQQPSPPPSIWMTIMIMVFSAALAGVGAWFLVRNKPAFSTPQ